MTAAEFIMNRVPSCTVVPYMGKIQDFDEDFYRQFQIVVSGLDNIEARRWLNSVLVGMVSGHITRLIMGQISYHDLPQYSFFTSWYLQHLLLLPSETNSY